MLERLHLTEEKREAQAHEVRLQLEYSQMEQRHFTLSRQQRSEPEPS
jgi:hypothetical protein